MVGLSSLKSFPCLFLPLDDCNGIEYPDDGRKLDSYKLPFNLLTERNSSISCIGLQGGANSIYGSYQIVPIELYGWCKTKFLHIELLLLY